MSLSSILSASARVVAQRGAPTLTSRHTVAQCGVVARTGWARPTCLNQGAVVRPRMMLLRTPARQVKSTPSTLSLIVRPAIFCCTVTAGSFAVAAWVRAGDRAARMRGEMKSRLRRAHGVLDDMWAQLPMAKRVVGCIAASYVTVFVLWKIPRLQSFMMRHFIHYPYSGHMTQLVGSHFSHVSVVHLAFNTMALWSFGVPVANLLGTEQFLAVCVGAGMMSGLVSQLHSVAIGCATPGLGASGVIMGLIGVFAFTHPSATIYIPFLPFIQGTATSAFGLLVAVDILGMAMGWRVLGHAAHFGGQVFGVLYVFGLSGAWVGAVQALTKVRYESGL
eukprot:m.18301 g.18301  ORF g.18301 m.18301 type:complete len:334 (-) comp3582_c0_seq1:283-1284(-)